MTERGHGSRHTRSTHLASVLDIDRGNHHQRGVAGHFVRTRRRRRRCVGAKIITVSKSYRYERTLIEPRRLNNSHKPDSRFIRRLSSSIARTRTTKMKKPLFSFTLPYKDDRARNYGRVLRLILSLFSGSHRDSEFFFDSNEGLRIAALLLSFRLDQNRFATFIIA